MNILDRYVARTVIGGTMMALLVLGALLAFVDFVSEIGDVGKGNYSLFDAIFFVVLSLPNRLYELFPTAVLLGSLLSLGALATNSELTVMRASGISIARISRSVLQAGLILVAIVALIGEFVVPPSERHAQTIRASALKQNIALGGQHGFWAKDGLRYIYVGRVYPDLHLGNVDIYELNESKEVVSIVQARSAQFINNRWELRFVKRSVFGEDIVNSEILKSDQLAELLNPDLFNVVSVKPANMSAIDLYRYSEYLQDNELDSSHYRLAFWIKVITPISSLVMLLIAMPFVFGSQRTGSAGNRVLVGLLLGIGFFLLNRTMNHLGQVYGLYPLFSAAFPVVLVAIAGMFALKRVR